MYYIPLHNKIGSCLDCPCLETLADIPSETSATFNMRICRATGGIIMVHPSFDANNIPANWDNFPIPNFCPIQFVDFK